MKKGDKVRVINYGHAIWLNKGEDLEGCVVLEELEHKELIDIHPELIGREGTIEIVKNLFNGEVCYYVSDIPGKACWYAQEQLEKV